MDDNLSLNQLDVLKELGTVGAGRAATAFAELISSKVEISVPQTSLVPLEKISHLLGDVDRPFFVLDSQLEGEITGRILLLFSPQDAKGVASLLLGKKPEEVDFDDAMVKSSLMECTNILSGSYITALVEMTNLNIISSVPHLAMDMVGAILDFIFIQIAQYSEQAFFIRTDLKINDRNIEGLFLLFPDVESLNKIFNILNINK
jgi:chemotaxis protein CheC